MDCKEFERLIPAFIFQKMDYQMMMKFNEHMEHCENCKEELVIQFLVTEGLQRLEEGDAFDLQSELDHRLNEAKRKVRFHNTFIRLGELLEIVFVVLLAGAVIWIIR